MQPPPSPLPPSPLSSANTETIRLKLLHARRVYTYVYSARERATPGEAN